MLLLKREDFQTERDWYDYLGNYAEKRFGEEAAKRNYHYYFTNRVMAHDGMLEINGQLSKIQVKGISRNRRESRSKIFTLKLHGREKTNSAGQVKYTKDNVDYFGLYLVEHDILYLIPSDVILKNETVQSIDLYNSEIEIDYKKQEGSSTIDVAQYKVW